MSRLMHSNLSRLGKSKMFWLGNGLILLFCLYTCGMMWIEKSKGYEGSLINCFFNELLLLGIVMAVVCSLLVGTEYSDGILRNKLTMGHSRKNIYFANFITCFLAGLTAYAIAMLVYCTAQIAMFGGIGESMGMLALFMGDGVLVCMGYAAIFNMLAMLNSNKTYGAVISILTAVIMFVLVYQLYNALMQPEVVEKVFYTIGGEMQAISGPNPHYISGMTRTIYQFLMELLPTGQGVLLMELNVRNPYLYGAYSILLSLCVNLIGFGVFRKKDIK